MFSSRAQRSRWLACLLACLSGSLGMAHAANPCNTSVTWQQADSGIGGTGQQADAGMGGTGRMAQGGIGGTGALAESGIGGTGIVGVVTGFASLCVNGLEIFYDAGTPTEINGQPSSASHVNLGQVVAVQAAAQGGSLHATRIQVVPVMTAPVEAVEVAAQGTGSLQRVRMLGQDIRIPEGLLGRNILEVGRMVSLSGFYRPDGTWLLLRADPAEDTAPVTLNGVLDAQGRMAGVPLVNLPASQPGQVLQEQALQGQDMQVQGHWDGQQLHVARVSTGAIGALARAGQAVGIQGYVADGATPATWQLNGHTVTRNAQTRIIGQPLAGVNLVIVRGTLGARGEILASEIEHGHERDLLERGGSPLRPERLPPPGTYSGHPAIDHAHVLPHIEAPLGEAAQHLERPPRPERPEHGEGIERFQPAGRPGGLDMHRPERPPRPPRPGR